jgi:hypothetical protein
MALRTEIYQSLKQKDLAQSRTNGNFFVVIYKLPALLGILVKTWTILQFLSNAFRFCFRTTGSGYLALIGAISSLFFLKALTN